MRGLVGIAFALLAFCTAGRAQEIELVRLPLRVSSSGAGGVVVIDRGTRDKVAAGDAVLFFARDGARYKGVVIEVRERTSVVEMQEDFVPPPGTKGEVSFEKSRLEAKKEKEPGAGTAAAGTAAKDADKGKEKWTNKDKGFKPGAPLLSGVRPLKPEDRRKKLTGRAYLIAQLTDNPSGNFDNSLFRIGTDLTYMNVFGRGGGLRFNGEAAYLTDALENDPTGSFLLRRLSYFRGGTRFKSVSWEVGRFLQRGMPEFEVLDGIEVGKRTRGLDRWGFSAGYMPEADDNYASFTDFQLAGFYEYVADVRESLMAGLGYQKSWHNGSPDRDLIIGKFKWVPDDTWNVWGTLWVDYYTGGDLLRSGFDVTYAILQAVKTWKSGNSIEVYYRRVRFPYTQRNQGFIPPPDLTSLIDKRYDRVAMNAYLWLSEDQWRLTTHLSGWDAESGSGGAGELGVELFAKRTRMHLVAYGSAATFENTWGARITIGQQLSGGRWDFMYDFSNHHLKGFPPDFNDLFQHRVRLSGSIHKANGWDISVYGEALYYDEELNWSVGVTLSRRF